MPPTHVIRMIHICGNTWFTHVEFTHEAHAFLVWFSYVATIDLRMWNLRMRIMRFSHDSHMNFTHDIHVCSLQLKYACNFRIKIMRFTHVFHAWHFCLCTQSQCFHCDVTIISDFRAFLGAFFIVVWKKMANQKTK